MPTAIVTGASRGLGRALSQALLARGWSLVVGGRDPEALAAVWAGELRVTAVAGDVSDPAHRHELIEAAGEQIDALVNNASVLGPSPQPALRRYSLEELRRVYEVNLFAPLALVQIGVPRLASGARILNVSSDAAVEPYQGWGGYGSSKAALDQLSAILGAEHPGLRVYAVDPGDMRTRLQQEAFPGEDISDRPLPEETAVPGLIALLEGDLASGRYRATELVGAAA